MMNVRCEFSSDREPVVEGSNLVRRLSNSGLSTLNANSHFLPGIKRTLSVPTTSSPCSLDTTTSSTKPTFRIQLPSRTPTSLSLPAIPTQQITPITATHFPSSLGDPLFPSFRSTALLTPPDERLNSPLDLAVHTSNPLHPTSPDSSQSSPSLQPPTVQPSFPQSIGFSNRSQSSNLPEKMAEVPSTSLTGAQSQIQTPTGNTAVQNLIETQDLTNATHWLTSGLDVVCKEPTINMRRIFCFHTKIFASVGSPRKILLLRQHHGALPGVALPHCRQRRHCSNTNRLPSLD